MALAIRLTRGGAKKRPYYRIVVADSRSPRDGRFIEKLGTYNPLLPREHAQRITLDKERIAHWLKVGAQPRRRPRAGRRPLRTDEQRPRSAGCRCGTARRARSGTHQELHRGSDGD